MLTQTLSPQHSKLRETCNTPRVLLAEDDPGLARTIKRILSISGAEVTTVDNGLVAVNMLTQEAFDVVLSDIHMPGMSGTDLLSVVRAYDLDLPVVLMTALPQVNSAVEAVELGALQYLIKPIDPQTLTKAVDRATKLHRIAQKKREALQLLNEHQAATQERLLLSRTFERTLETLWMAYQPIVIPTEHRLFAYEALMRSPQEALPNPASVLAAAERLNRLHELGRKVRELAVDPLMQVDSDILLFINLHAQELTDPYLFDKDQPLHKIAHRVVLEITEHGDVNQLNDLQGIIQKLRSIGYRIALDDLGAGYASLSSFALLEPEFIKLDISIVRGICNSQVQKKLALSILSLCKDLNTKVIAEGIENEQDLETLLSLGCTIMQGYFFAKPGPAFPKYP